jgi:hypothetical protein
MHDSIHMTQRQLLRSRVRVLLIKWLTQDRCVARDVILPGGSGEMTSNRDERRRGVPRLSVDMFYHHPSPTAGEIEIILPS